MKIQVHRNESSSPVVYENAENGYTKGPVYCILLIENGKKIIHKYPLVGIFRIIEDY